MTKRRPVPFYPFYPRHCIIDKSAGATFISRGNDVENTNLLFVADVKYDSTYLDLYVLTYVNKIFPISLLDFQSTREV